MSSIHNRNRNRRENSSAFAAVFEEKQIAEFKEAFSVLDVDSNGFIDKEDLKDVLQSLGQNPSDQYVEDMINEASGNINFTTFLTLMTNRLCALDPETDILSAFEVFDEDGTGKIDADALRHVMASLGDRLTNEEIDVMMQDCVDENNQFNYRNFVRTLKHGIVDKS